MQIRLLGPMEVAVGDHVDAPAGTGERSLLALLALRAGRVVPAEQLIDALWGESLPANPANALQLRVSKLRKWLVTRGVDAAVVATRAPGYVLDVDPSSVDAAAFGHEVADARASAASQRKRMAMERYRSALRRWRGPALCDVGDEAWAAPEARRLEELRVTALEECLALELDLGRHGEALDELDALVVEHPLRERFHVLRMLARYRAGRQADALAAYQELRALLSEELGLDPSLEARELESAILRHDPGLKAPASPPGRVRSTLPERVASVRGRDACLDEVAELLRSQRLVTLVGPGGAGKTTLAVEAARRTEPALVDGAWLVLLAGVTNPDHVVGQVAAALDLPTAQPVHGESPEEGLARQLAARQALIVLDNCEHVVEAAAALADRLLARCPDVTVLATSREPLLIDGEVRFAVPPLPVPAADAHDEEIESSPSVQLFVDRAAALDRSFRLDAASLPKVAEICRRVDGLPLAIELAAARTTTLAVEEVASRLGDRLSLLSGRSRTADTRHRTLRATVAWSHDLLHEHERVLFRRLAIFRGPWDLAAVEKVCTDETVSRDAVLDLVGALVDRSLVVRHSPNRFRLLETIRDFAGEQLALAGEHDALHRRQLQRLVALAEAADPNLRGADQLPWLELLRAHHDDLRAALGFCEEHAGEHGVDGLRLAAALGWFWYLGDHEEGRRHLARLLAAAPAAPAEIRGRALLATSMVGRPSACVVHPSEPCAAAAEEARRLFEAAGDRAGAALACLLVAVEGARGVGTEAALDLVDAASRDLAAGGDAWALALAEFVRMEILSRAARGEEAIGHGDRAAAAFARLGDQWGLSAVRAHQGANLRAMGPGPRRHPLLRDRARRGSRGRDAQHRPVGQRRGGHHAGGQGRRRTGPAPPDRGAVPRPPLRVLRGDAAAHLGFGHLARRAGDLEAALAEYRAAVVGIGAVGQLVYLACAHSGVGFVSELRGDAAEAEAAHRRVLEIAEVIREAWMRALGLEGLAGVAASRGDYEEAAELLGTANGIRLGRKRAPSDLERMDIDRISATLTANLPARRLDAALERGRPAASAAHGGGPASPADQLITSKPAS